MDALSIAASGIQSAGLGLAVSAHNVANLTTPSFSPQRAVQQSEQPGGSSAFVQQRPAGDRVDLSSQFVDQIRSELQFRGSAVALDVAARTQKQLIDLFA